MLEQETHAARLGRQVDAGGCVQQRATVQPDMACTDRQQPGQGLQRQRLAGARRAVEGDERCVCREGDVEVKAPAGVADGDLEPNVDQGLPNP